MNRKLAGALAAIAVIAFAVWFFALRERGGTQAAPAATQGSAKVELPQPKPPSRDEPAPQGMAPR